MGLFKKPSFLELSWYFTLLINLINTDINSLYFVCFYIIVSLVFLKKIKLSNLIIAYIFIFNFDLILIYNKVFFFKNLRVLTTTLTNGLFLIHPLLLYASYSTIILLIEQKLLKNFLSKKFKERLGVLSLYSLILGGWWAQQELNWNGWWGWDFVEILGLISFLFLIILIHLENRGGISLKSSINIIISISILVLSTKLGVVNSVHAFISASLTEGFIFFFFFLFGTFFFFKKKNITNKNTQINIIFIFFFWIFFFLLVYWLFHITLLSSKLIFIDLYKNLSSLLVLLIYIFLLNNYKVVPLLMMENWLFIFTQNISKIRRWDYHFLIFLFLISIKYIYITFCGIHNLPNFFFLQFKFNNYSVFCSQYFNFFFFQLNDYLFFMKKKRTLKSFDVIHNQNYYNINLAYYFFENKSVILVINFIVIWFFIFFLYLLLKKKSNIFKSKYKKNDFF